MQHYGLCPPGACADICMSGLDRSQSRNILLNRSFHRSFIACSYLDATKETILTRLAKGRRLYIIRSVLVITSIPSFDLGGILRQSFSSTVFASVFRTQSSSCLPLLWSTVCRLQMGIFQISIARTRQLRSLLASASFCRSL